MIDTETDRYEEPYQPPDSLWQLIKSLANEKELDVIKSVIGESLVETSIDLHNEIDSLLEIWRDYRNETLITLDRLRRDRVSVKLAEPANVRDNLKQEIGLYVKQLREHFRNDETKFRRQITANEHNVRVINYVMNSGTLASTNTSNETLYDVRSGDSKVVRPKSSVRRDTGRETPIVSARGRSSRCRRRSQSVIRYRSQSALSNRSDDDDRIRARSVTPSVSSESSFQPHTTTALATNRLGSVLDEQAEFLVDEDKLNCMQIDDIVESLRDMFQKECDQLLEDIDFLYECIDDENEYRHRSNETMQREPSLHELKEERRRLESDLMSATGKNQLHISTLPSEVSRQNHNRSIHSPVMANATTTMRSRRVTPSPPSSAKTTTSSTTTTSTIRSTTNSTTNKPMTTPKPSVAMRSPTIVTNSSKSNQLNLHKLNSKLIPKESESAAADKPIIRPNSVDDSLETSSVSSSSSSNNRVGSAQKFRQMVFEWRD